MNQSVYKEFAYFTLIINITLQINKWMTEFKKRLLMIKIIKPLFQKLFETVLEAYKNKN